jgi:2-dehydro-3-deoxyglucarate aldolase
MIRVCLDAGVSGLIFSTVESDTQSKEIKEICNYPSFGGSRGLGLVRENLWGSKNLATTKPILIAQIETLRGVENVKEILSNGFDYYMIGPYDLSASLGQPGIFDSKLFLDSLEKVKNQVSESKMAVHIPSRVKEELKKYKNYGIIALGMDTTFLIEKYQEVEEYA